MLAKQKLEENYFKVRAQHLKYDALIQHLSLPKGRYSKLILDGPPLKRYKTKAADSRYAKASGRRTKKDKDLEDSNTSSDLDSPLDSDDYRLDSSSDINPKDDLENEKATTAKDLAREQKKRLKALLNAKQSLCKSRDSNRILHSRRLTDAYILYFKELLSNNSRIFANAIGISKTRAIVLAVLIEYVHFKN
ncbi:hypothetical protein HBI07_116340 [Parastagonospora nodorum]|nr:hypothetical protein HBI07_116340 [Parastagonospora nodorum]